MWVQMMSMHTARTCCCNSSIDLTRVMFLYPLPDGVTLSDIKFCNNIKVFCKTCQNTSRTLFEAIIILIKQLLFQSSLCFQAWISAACAVSGCKTLEWMSRSTRLNIYKSLTVTSWNHSTHCVGWYPIKKKYNRTRLQLAFFSLTTETWAGHHPRWYTKRRCQPRVSVLRDHFGLPGGRPGAGVCRRGSTGWVGPPVAYIVGMFTAS